MMVCALDAHYCPKTIKNTSMHFPLVYFERFSHTLSCKYSQQLLDGEKYNNTSC